MRAYATRILRAAGWIERRLTEPIRVADVAAQAGYSAYHFHRIFTAVTGEPVMEYVRRRRLTEAARRLREGDRPILDLALEFGFDSQEAFTRAFKRAFSITPGAYRRNGRPINERAPLTRATLDHLLGGITMEPEYVELEPFRVIGMASWFTPETMKQIPELWDRFVKRMDAVEPSDPTVSYGICSGDPDGFFYMAGVPVSGLDSVPQDMVGKIVGGGRYARFVHSGPVSEIGKTMDYIWGTWLPRSGEEPDRERNDFERYDDRFDPATMSGEIEVYLPLKRS